MRRKLIGLVIAGLLAVLLGTASLALAAAYTWNYAGDGNWSDADKWTPAGGPPSSTSDTAWVDSTGANVTVYLNSSYNISQLQVDAGDTVFLNNSTQLGLYGGALNVAGAVSVNSTGNWTSLYAAYALSLTGGGKVVLGGTSSFSRISGAAVTNTSGNRIEGQGQIQANLVNQGTVTAQGGALELNTSISVNNSGVMTTNAGGDILHLNGVSVSGTGRIDPGPGLLRLNSATLTDHQIGAGAVQLTSTSNFYGLTTLDAATQVAVPSGLELRVYNSGSNNAALSGGVITLTNAGSWTSLYAGHALSLQSKVVLEGTGATSRISGAQVTNELGNSIEGQGVIQASLVNKGVVTAKGGALNFTANVNNSGVITNETATDTLHLSGMALTGTGGIDPGAGLLKLTGATLTDQRIGAGAVQLATTSNFYGATTMDTATQVAVSNGLEFRAYNSGANNAALSGGVININNSGGWTSLYAGHDLSLNSQVVLQGTGTSSRIYGATVTNEAGNSIEGQGVIQASLVNKGVVTAKGGALDFTANVNNSGVITNETATDTLHLNGIALTGTGGIDPGPGLLKLTGATLTDQRLGAGAVQLATSSNFYGLTTMAAGTQVAVNGLEFRAYNSGDNNAAISGGVININNAGGWTSLYAGHALTLQDGAKVVLGGTSEYSRIYGTQVTTTANSSIEGQGHLQAAVVNNGTITAKNGALYVENNITGSGKVSVAGGATLSAVTYDVQTGNFEMLGSAVLTGSSSRIFTLSKNFTFTQTDESTWNGGAGFRLAMNGGGPQQSLEVGGLDSDAVLAGFTSNFHLDRLTVSGSNSYAYLSDAFNNGNRYGPGGNSEALYVDLLQILTGNTLNLNSLHLYTMHDGNPYQITLADSGAAWLGGGEIIDSPVPVPGAVWLLGSGLLGLGLPGLRRRLRRK